jgi:hypothetical protein
MLRAEEQLADVLDRVYVVEQLYYLAQQNPLDAQKPFEVALRNLGEDCKRVREEGTLPQMMLR